MIAAFHPCVPCCAVLCRGVLNIVHGTHDTVNRILDHPDIAAVSFVGGDKAGRYIYERAAANGKRVQVSTCACGMARACNRPCVLSSRLLVLQHTINRAGIQVLLLLPSVVTLWMVSGCAPALGATFNPCGQAHEPS